MWAGVSVVVPAFKNPIFIIGVFVLVITLGGTKVNSTAYAARVKALVKESLGRQWYPDAGHDILINHSYVEQWPAEKIADAIVRDIVQAIEKQMGPKQCQT